MLRALANTNVHWDYLSKESSKNHFPNPFPIGHLVGPWSPECTEGNPGLRPNRKLKLNFFTWRELRQKQLLILFFRMGRKGWLCSLGFREPRLGGAWLARVATGVDPWHPEPWRQQSTQAANDPQAGRESQA